MSRLRIVRAWCLAVALVVTMVSLPGSADPAAAAPSTSPRSPGPRLTVTARALDKALRCSGRLRGARHDPVLLTPAFSTGKQSYGVGYARQLTALGIATCTLTLPDRGFRDLQHAA